MVWLIIVGVLVAIAVAVFLRRRSGPVAEPPTTPQRPPRPPETPMIGLESALAEVTGRDGRPIGERIDAESQHVDDLRIADDTGPLLRRALDHVAPRPDGQDGQADVDPAVVTEAVAEHPGDDQAEPAAGAADTTEPT